MCECPPDLKFNVEAIDILIRSHLLNMREFDLHLVQVRQETWFVPVIKAANNGRTPDICQAKMAICPPKSDYGWTKERLLFHICSKYLSYLLEDKSETIIPQSILKVPLNN